MILEIEILEQCEGPTSYGLIERTVVEGNRAHLLNVLRHLHRDGYIEVQIDGANVPGWRIENWSRNPASQDTDRDLAQVALATTGKGVRYWFHGES